MSKNLITGGKGFIGYHLATELLNRGEEVVLFDIVQDPTLLIDRTNRVKFVRGDLSNWSQVLDTVKNNSVEIIYHAGALVAARAEEDPPGAYAVNVNGTYHVLEAARLFGVGKVMFCSSLGTYGAELPPTVNEDVIQMPTSMYGVTKVIGERLSEYYWRRFRIDVRGIRFPPLMGAGRKPDALSAYVSLIVQEPALGKPYRVIVDESTRVPLLYIKDAVSSLISLKEASGASLMRRFYNVQGFCATAGQQAEAVRRYIPTAKIEFFPEEAAMRIVNSWPKEVDDSRARQEWGWKPKYDLEAATRDFVQDIYKNSARYK